MALGIPNEFFHFGSPFIGLFSLITNTTLKKLPLIIPALLVVLFISKFPYFIADERGEVLAQMEDFAFVPRLDFYGLVYIYALFLSFLLYLKTSKLKKAFSIFVSIIIFMSIVRDTYALKVWKLGFDAELKTYKRIMKSYESSPNFTPYKRYIIVQAGSPSLRHRFYHSPYTIKSEDLLDISYVPGMNASVTTNYYKSPEYGDPTAYVYTFAPDPKALNFLKQARPWPHPNSYSVGNYWIMIIYDQQSLHLLKNRYLPQ